MTVIALAEDRETPTSDKTLRRLEIFYFCLLKTQIDVFVVITSYMI